ncbi:MAG TPA: outer membrane beta-barrel protein [Gammaproteobacteria bacterium]
MKIKGLLTITAVAAALGLPFAAQADDGWSNFWQQSFIGVDVGRANHGGSRATTIPGFTNDVSDNDTGWRMNLGYQFNRVWALELGYVNLGTTRLTATGPGGSFTSERKARGFVIDGTAMMPFTDTFSGFLRLGTIDGHVQENDTSVGTITVPSSSTSSDDWRATYGVGLDWRVADHLSLRLGWDQYHQLGNSSNVGENNVNFTSLGVLFRF